MNVMANARSLLTLDFASQMFSLRERNRYLEPVMAATWVAAGLCDFVGIFLSPAIIGFQLSLAVAYVCLDGTSMGVGYYLEFVKKGPIGRHVLFNVHRDEIADSAR